MGDGFLIHGCCHNPTGLDLAPDDSNRLLQVLEHRGAFPIVDCAYAGFSEAFDEDLFVAREVFRTFEEAIICFSFSKNFSLYRERTGFILVNCAEAQTVANVTLVIANIARSSYSMLPYHGAAIVSTILEDDILYRMW
jgi:aspartate aminotransferase